MMDRRRVFTHSRHHSPPARVSRSRYSSPPAAFRHPNISPRGSSFRSRGPPVSSFRSRPPHFFRARHASPPFRGGWPPARFSTRSRPFRIPYHARPDISPPRYTTRRSRSPPARSPHARSSYSPPTRGRGGFRGFRAGRGGRSSAIIGNFGRPMHHPPAYDVSPDRTEATGEEKKEVDEPKDRDELFTKMMEAKKSENLDEYYRLRDQLNAFDKRNPHLAFHGSGRVMKRRRRSESKEKSEEKEGTLSKRRSSAAAEELEEVDSIDAHELHGEEKKRRMSSNRKEEKKKLPKEKGKSHGGAKRADKSESDVDDEHQSQRDSNLESSSSAIKSERADYESSLLEDELEEEVGFDLVENELDHEAINRSLAPQFNTSKETIETLHEAEAIGAGYEGEEDQETYNDEQNYGVMFRPDFVSILQSSLKRGIRMSIPKLRSTITTSSDKPSLLENGNGVDNQQQAAKDKDTTTEPPTLLELALCQVVSNTISQEIDGTH